MDNSHIQLTAATIDDKSNVYKWLSESDITSSMFGIDNLEKPTWEEFCEDYIDCYFDGTAPEYGRVFIIMNNDKKIGCISYACFHVQEHMAELDIWMDSEASCGRGYGTRAISALCEYLAVNLGVVNLIIRPSNQNKRAIEAYKKAGFEEVDKDSEVQVLHRYLKDEYYAEYGQGDYGEEGTLTLVRDFERTI